jgi:hypothetical protein
LTFTSSALLTGEEGGTLIDICRRGRKGDSGGLGRGFAAALRKDIPTISINMMVTKAINRRNIWLPPFATYDETSTMYRLGSQENAISITILMAVSRG